MMKFRFLALTVVAASCMAVAVQAQSLQQLNIPDEVTAELQGEPVDFELSSPESMLVELSLTSTTFDPYLEILDTSGEIIAQNDDGGEDSGSLLNFQVEANTVYTVRARSYSSDASGLFTLTVGGNTATELTLEEPLTANLENKGQFLTFTGKAGDEVDFVVEGGDYDTVLSLMDSSGNSLLTSDDGIGVNPFISDFLLPEDGTYILHLTSYSDEPPTDPVLVTVRPTTIQTLVFGEAATSDQEKSYLRFEAQAGTTYRIELRGQTTSYFSVDIISRVGETTEAGSSSYGVTALTLEFTAANDGFYKLTSSGTSNGEFQPYTATVTEVK